MKRLSRVGLKPSSCHFQRELTGILLHGIIADAGEGVKGGFSPSKPASRHVRLTRFQQQGFNLLRRLCDGYPVRGRPFLT